MGQVRDYELFGPQTQKLIHELEGKKTIIVGKKHISNLERALRGEPLQQPPDWKTHLQTALNESGRKSIERFSNLANKGLSGASLKQAVTSRFRFLPPLGRK